MAGMFLYSLIFILLSSILAYAYLFVKPALHIRIKTIRMQAPIGAYRLASERNPVLKNSRNEQLVACERRSRQAAYKNTSISTGDSFFDDSDMLSEYYLVVVYDQLSDSPLLTARYYFNKSVITSCLRGDGPEGGFALPDTLHAGKIFLADRLSGNTGSAVYRRFRHYIFLLFYSEILIRNRDCYFILMARQEKHEKLLKKYLRLGLDAAGKTLHKGRVHWVLLGEVQKSYAVMRRSVLFNALVVTRFLFYKLN